jgi:hypothetical protein
MIAPRIHMFLLVHQKKEGPHMDPISFMDNLQKKSNSVLLNTSFWQFQITQSKAQTPTLI